MEKLRMKNMKKKIRIIKGYSSVAFWIHGLVYSISLQTFSVIFSLNITAVPFSWDSQNKNRKRMEQQLYLKRKWLRMFAN